MDTDPFQRRFSDGGPDVRWVGNERGAAGDSCWVTLNRAGFSPGDADSKCLNSGDCPGSHRLIRGDFVTTDKVRLHIMQASVCPALKEIGLFVEPKVMTEIK